MKCPKCSYLGFERVERCRNCGYEFSLTEPIAVPELPIRSATDTVGPLDDLSLTDAGAVSAAPSHTETGPDLEHVLGAPVSGRRGSGELPLFGGSMIPDDQPLITKPSPPRPPLAVRRATPEVARLRTETPRAQPLDLSLDLDPDISMDPSFSPALRATGDRWSSHRADEAEPAEDAAVVTRFVAVVIDLLILMVIDAIVIYFTLQICGITIADIGIVPKGPLLAFLLVQNLGYLVAFTASGQTLGKMATGIRVVSARPESSLDLGRALLRTMMWLVLAVPAGLGFLTAVLSRDHRGLHDRFAGTRVVR